jgi:hypothetical protein
MKPRQKGPVSETSLLIFSIQAFDSSLIELLQTSSRRALLPLRIPGQVGLITRYPQACQTPKSEVGFDE